MLLEKGNLVRDGSLADVPLAGTAENEPVSVTRTSEAKGYDNIHRSVRRTKSAPSRDG